MDDQQEEEEEEEEEGEEDVNLEGKSDFERQQLLVNILHLHLSIHLLSSS